MSADAMQEVRARVQAGGFELENAVQLACAIEAVWSGSWHESTFVTCPLGHEHEID